MFKVGSIKNHFLGFMSKCAEYGVTEPYTVGTLYKMALQRPVGGRGPRQVVGVYGENAGRDLGFETAQGRPDLQGRAFRSAQEATGMGPPHLYRRAVEGPRRKVSDQSAAVGSFAGASAYIPPLPPESEYPDIEMPHKDFWNSVSPPRVSPPTPAYKHPDFDPRGGYGASYFMSISDPGANFHYSTRGDHTETGTADMTTNLTIDPADTQTDMQRRIMDRALN